ncbi:hypothetical protein Cs7R123_32410 [Catellatospora sp. TT07R-123]|uniref:hypothetical protein n=1 Tax=Catellatospora sp. TT07R-123 TaxID=2733863 RepID=UPI001AFD0B25|nr:hypothetical protein [Catellatospora sp. TT07R-123]GHJ45899.1 hypothetical protein Cs7R123_32410 [Catellatospora sp. TT07R-123]
MPYTEFSNRSPEASSLRVAVDQAATRVQQSVLIEAHAARAAKLSPSDVHGQFAANPFSRPSDLDQRAVLEFERCAMDVIPLGARMVELSPVTAFAAHSSLTGISQKTVLSTIRNTEVVADGVVVLALLAAEERRQAAYWNGTMLGTFHRELRTQAHEQPGFTSHFRALSLVSTESTRDSTAFKAAHFARHVGIYLDILDETTSLGYRSESVTVALSNLRILELVIRNERLDRAAIMRHTQTPGFSVMGRFGIPLPRSVRLDELPALTADLPSEFTYLRRALRYLETVFEPTRNALEDRPGAAKTNIVVDLDRHAGMGYYEDACVKISASNELGETFPLVDIGTNTWLTMITNDRSDRLMTGGMGTELFIKKFRSR